MAFTDLNAAMGSELFTKLTGTTSWQQAVTLFLQTTRQRIALDAESPSRIQAYAAAIRAAPAANPIEWAADQLSVSARHVRRVFDRELGISPKRFTRILRLLKIMRAADVIARPPWAQLAHSFGYADQAHLINESRALVGKTPATLHHARRAENPSYRLSGAT